MKTREERIEHHRMYCVHYDPQGAGCGCKAGMDRQTIQGVAVGDRGMKWGPCMEGHTLEDPLQHCAKWERRSRESGEEYADSIDRCMKRMEIVDPVISVWRKKLPIGKAEVIECPVCKGRLHLSQAAYNGHVRAKCETGGCVNFIE